ncbi:hematopoietic cell signal transducer [Phascolarctos cinereus]|uniref:Hematopoietic cell signal transducer n=1 Tax=Phascolarctos cinereus TaxID=38626 RepID=A0A6P5J8Y2_PHACI|nr:hematopoietic cell signal transducer [Phascolarctos cinereus]
MSPQWLQPRLLQFTPPVQDPNCGPLSLPLPLPLLVGIVAADALMTLLIVGAVFACARPRGALPKTREEQGLHEHAWERLSPMAPPTLWTDTHIPFRGSWHPVQPKINRPLYHLHGRVRLHSGNKRINSYFQDIESFTRNPDITQSSVWKSGIPRTQLSA